MWTKIAVGLICFLGLLVLVIAGTGHFTVGVELPPGSEPPHQAWLLGWLFVCLSAVIIVAVTAVRLVFKAINFIRNSRKRPASGPWA